jgi:hypothetical protein
VSWFGTLRVLEKDKTQVRKLKREKQGAGIDGGN